MTPSTIDIPSFNDSKLILVAAGEEVKVFDAEKKVELLSCNPFKQRLGIAKFVQGKDELAVFASAESNKVEVWNLKKASCVYAVDCHSAVATDVTFTPLEGYMMVSSRDGSYSFHDLNSFVKLNQFYEEEAITQT